MADLDQLGADDIERYFAVGLPARRKISDEPVAYLLIDPAADVVALRVPLDGESPDVESFMRIDLDVVQESGDDQMWFELRVDAEGARYEAYLVVASIVDLLRGGAGFRQAAEEALIAFRGLLADRTRLSVEQQVGLFGELLLLEHCLDSIGNVGTLDAWLGSFGEEHDFSFDAFDVEVKTTRSESRKHLIGSVTQLEATPDRDLYLLSIQITAGGAAAQGTTLGDLVARVRTRFSENEADRFALALAEVRWRDEDESLYPARYVLRSTPAAFLVDGEFPAITRARIADVVPSHEMVVGLSYRLDLTNAARALPPHPIDTFCEDLHDGR